MIISVDPTNTEDIATFALVKQYRLVPLSTTLAMTAWTADATNGGYTLTQNVSDTGILLYTDPSVVVAFNASVEDTTSAPAGQDANVIATEIQADATNTCYIVTFHADTIPVADVVVNLLIYGTTIPGQSSGEDPATAEEITAAVLQNLDGRVSALETAIPNKVDKRTGAGKYAYTHNGSTQGDTEIVDGTTATTIPIRDANGRMQAADPASGATDKTLVTANWISQTGAGRPNNVLHDSGNESFSGTKSSNTLQIINSRPYLFQRVASSNNWFKVFEFPNQSRRTVIMDLLWSHQSYNLGGAGRIIILIAGANTYAKWMYRYGNDPTMIPDCVFVGYKGGKVEIWVKSGLYTYSEIVRSIKGNVEEAISDISNVYDGTAYATIDTTQYAYYAYGSD